jgi:hypothetical protein
MADTGTQGQEPESKTETTAETKGTDPYAGLPAEFAWLKDDLESTRREAASRRVALREAEDKLKDAKTPEDIAAAVKEASTKSAQLEAELARERAARKHKLADELLEFITGTTEEQIDAQAAKLAALATSAPREPAPVAPTRQSPRGGVTPADSSPPDIDGREAWRKFKGRR